MLKLHKTLTAAFTAMCLAATPALAAGEGWTEDYDTAKTQAGEQSKDLLLEFTGSDWCPPCKALNEAVFSHDSFAEGASENFVLVKLDFPRNKQQSDELKQQNRGLQQQYSIRGYPTVMLTDAQGLPYAKTGFRRGGPEEYIAHLNELRQARVERDRHFAEAEKAEGVARAKHLFAGLQAVGDDMALAHYKEQVDEAIELDADGEAGIAKHYRELQIAKQQRADMQSMMRSAGRDADLLMTKIDEFLKNEELTKPIRQEVLAIKSQVQLNAQQDNEAAKATLLQAIEIDPESNLGKQLKSAFDRVFAEKEEAAEEAE